MSRCPTSASRTGCTRPTTTAGASTTAGVAARRHRLLGPRDHRPAVGAEGDDKVRQRVPRAGYRLIIRNITDKHKASEALRKAIACDHLTGLAPAGVFETAELEVGRWKRQPRALSLIMIDVDHFKAVNDTYGHPAGDAVLRGLAATLKRRSAKATWWRALAARSSSSCCRRPAGRRRGGGRPGAPQDRGAGHRRRWLCRCAARSARASPP